MCTVYRWDCVVKVVVQRNPRHTAANACVPGFCDALYLEIGIICSARLLVLYVPFCAELDNILA